MKKMKKLGSILIAFLLVFSLVGNNVFADENTGEEAQNPLNVAELQARLEGGLLLGETIDVMDYLEVDPDAESELITSLTAENASIEGSVVIFNELGDAAFTIVLSNGFQKRFPVEVRGEDAPVDNPDDGSDTDNDIADNGIYGFDADALREDLAEGVRQGTVIDVLDYYYQDSGLSVVLNSGGALTSLSRILLFGIGNVEFVVTDGEASEEFEVEVLEHRITGLTFDKTEATIGVGESVDMFIDFVPEDGWDDAFLTEDINGNITLSNGLNLSVEYEGTAIVLLRSITDDEGNFIGVRATGLTRGSGKLTAFITDDNGNINEEYQAAVATINVASGEVNPIDDYTPPVTPVAPVADGELAQAVNTADSMLLNIYVAAGMLSLAALVVVYKKKQNLISK